MSLHTPKNTDSDTYTKAFQNNFWEIVLSVQKQFRAFKELLADVKALEGRPPGGWGDGDTEDGEYSLIPGPTGARGATGAIGPPGFGEDGEEGQDSLVPGPKGATGPAGADGAGAVGRGYIDGYIITNNATTSKLDVAVGQCRDSTHTATLNMTSAITAKALQTSGAWAAGSTQNGLDTGAAAADTWYHIYAILKDSDQSVDIIFSTSASGPSLPAGYTYFRRIGSLKTDGSKNFISFVQNGDNFHLSTPVLDISAVSIGTSRALQTLPSVPSGIIVEALTVVACDHATLRSDLRICDPALADVSTSGTETLTVRTEASGVFAIAGGGAMRIRTNTSQQVAARGDNTSMRIWIGVWGWIDARGKQ